MPVVLTRKMTGEYNEYNNMQGIDFEDDRNFSGISSRIPVQSAKPSFMMRLLARVGIGDTMTANYILLGVATVFFGITILLYADAGIFK